MISDDLCTAFSTKYTTSTGIELVLCKASVVYTYTFSSSISVYDELHYTDSTVCTGCCGTLDHIVTFFFKNLSKSKAKGSVSITPSQQTTFLHLLKIHSNMFQQMLSTIMNIIMFEKFRNQWSMSRPLLGLILLNEEVDNIW